MPCVDEKRGGEGIGTCAQSAMHMQIEVAAKGPWVEAVVDMARMTRPGTRTGGEVYASAKNAASAKYGASEASYIGEEAGERGCCTGGRVGATTGTAGPRRRRQRRGIGDGCGEAASAVER